MNKKWDREACVRAIEEYVQAHNKVPLTQDLRAPLPSPNTFVNCVGQSVLEYCRERYPEVTQRQGRGREAAWDREACVRAIEEYVQTHNKVPLTQDLRAPLPSPGTFAKYVGQPVLEYCRERYPDVTQRQGRGREPVWNRETCIQAVEDFIREHQAIPQMQELRPPLPSANLFKKYVGQPVGAYCKAYHPDLHGKATHRFTKEQIRAATDAFYAKHGRQARLVEHRAYNGLPSHNTVTACFNMTAKEYWDTFYPEPRQQWTVETVLEALKAYHAENGRLPTQTIFFNSTPQFPSKKVFEELSGGMRYKEFIRLHLQDLADNGWTQENILEAVLQFEEKYGSLPRTTDFAPANGLPPITTLYRKFPCQQLGEVYAQWLPEHQMRHARPAVEKKWNGDSVVQALRMFVEKNRRLPMTHEYSPKYGLPSYSTVRKNLGRTMAEIYQELFPEFSQPQDAQEPDEEQDFAESFGGMVMAM